MPISADKKVQALKAAALSKREDTLQRVQGIIMMMQEKNMIINFQSVSKQASVSKTWLYGEPEIRKQINGLRHKLGIIKKTTDLQAVIQKKDDEMGVLHQKVKDLEKTVSGLRIQLEVAYGELYKKNSN